jgi:hypothetical protein
MLMNVGTLTGFVQAYAHALAIRRLFAFDRHAQVPGRTVSQDAHLLTYFADFAARGTFDINETFKASQCSQR